MDIKELFLSFKKEDFFSLVNLHIHSNCSDGTEEFESLVETAKKKNLKYISITDHNSVEGHKKINDPILIKGVEFDCFYLTSPIHILGYGIDIYHPQIQKLCSNDKNDFIRLIKSRNPKRVIDAIHAAGGIAVLAHPCCTFTFNLKNYVKKLKSLGLDGIETYYPYDRFRSVVKFSSRKLPFEIAREFNLIQTGGSDEHGKL